MSATFDGQAGAPPALQDLMQGKTYTPGPEPYRRSPNAPTGLTAMVRGYMKTRATWTADDVAVDLRVNRKSVIDAVKNLIKTGEVELAEEPSKPAAPRVYRAAPTFDPTAKPEPRAPKAPNIVRVIDPVQMPAGPLLPPTVEDLNDAVAELLAMQTPPRAPPKPWEAPGVLTLDTAGWTWEQLLRAAQRLAREALIRYEAAHPDPVRAALAGGVEVLDRALRRQP